MMVKRVVDDIDEIVRAVRFDGWQATHAGEREVKKALRQTRFRLRTAGRGFRVPDARQIHRQART
ncbi:hypothetical protein DPM13_12705 [Paracoccus mutanolyticus]|uniref:Uncharacterized protein n=1 Tax=Paracoccus mutanolyticus TaxID=1499308 RepID=A0ABN5M702_9RHOB|nr:hypothetical protein [Paracoccus mutanolyticus]AWX93647.1 hypothetical protein DPM13_12705 [Paracoccus mutanolyticus]